jgi:hypothetical protein
VLFQFSFVQHQMATKLSDWVKDNFSISVKAEKLKVGLFSGLAFDHILLLDSSICR